MLELKLGLTATDSITGFTGVLVAKCEYLTGCTQWSLQPHGLKDGEIVKPCWFDESRLGVAGPTDGGPVGAMPEPQHP